MPEEQGKDISVRVALRSRPLISKELSEGCQLCLTFTPGEPQLVLGKDKAFTYDYVFKPEDTQDEVYTKTVAHLVDGLFKGYNATVLAYGQTGSGKTYAMGNAYNMTDPLKMGVIPRVIQHIFRGVQEKQDIEVMLKVSYLEIYNEDIHDLLARNSKETLAIREDIDGGIRVAGLCEVAVNSAQDMFQCLENGSVGRTTGSTAMNLQSSRSHAIFTIYLQLRKKDTSESYCHAKFHLVDLAGSERAKRTQAQGDRFKEGVNINRGLLALGNVISALGDENGRKAHIPYRDSKLTRLLQDSLGGNSQTVMIACVSPADSNMEETLNTLRYADRARRIKNKPVVNRDPHTAELAKLKQQVQQLQIQLLQGKILNGEGDPAVLSMEGSCDLKTLLERNKSLEAENEKLSHELQSSIDQTTQMYEKVILAEMSKDKLKQKLMELRAKADMSIGALDLTVLEEGHEGGSKVKEQLEVMKELQQKIVELETENQKETEGNAMLYGGESRPVTAESPSDGASTPDTSPSLDGDDKPSTPEFTKTHTLRQAALSRELHELNEALCRKQELAQKMGQSDEKMQVMKIQYETTMKQLEDQVSTLMKEKETLSHELFATKTHATSNKLSEQRRKRLQELEAQLSELKKKINTQAKLIKLKEKSDHTVKTLNTEISSMKQARVRLMKQMKEDTSRFQQWKQAKDKEVLQLKAKDRKRECEFTRLERQNQKTQNVLRRKMEEAAAANKRLKDALEKKSKAKTMKTDTNRLEGMGRRIKSWIDHELEVRVSVNEAKRHLASLLTDRKTLSQDIRLLENDASSKQAVSILNGKPVEVRLGEMKSEVELRNAQISDLQQKIMDADQDEKSQTNRWHNITSMPEAKCSIDRLMEAATLARVEMGQLDSKLAEMKSSVDDAQHDKEEMAEEINKIKMKFEQERTELQREHEDKILYLLTQLPSASDKTDDTKVKPSQSSADGTLIQRLHFQEEQISELKNIHDQLQETLSLNNELKQKLTLATYQGKRSALMPVLTSPEASPAPQPRPKKKKSTAAPKRQYLDESSEEWESESEYSPESESDWMETPIKRRKKSTHNSSSQSCGCRGNCGSRVCGCKKNGRGCGDDCRCDAGKCENRAPSETNSPNTTAGETMMNTTVVIEEASTVGDQADTPGLDDFKLPSSKPVSKPRKVLGEMKAPPQDPAQNLPQPPKPKLKREDGFSRKRSSDTAKGVAGAGLTGGVTNVENEGIVKRKRKLLGSTNRSFFKPLDV